MEGLIPFVYRAIVQYKNGREGHVLATWFNESPSANSYMRLPTGDSGRFLISDNQAFQSDYGNFSTSSPVSSMSTSSSNKIICSTGVQSPVYRRLTSRRVVT